MSHFTRRHFLKSAGAVGLLSLSLPHACTQQPRKPNIIYILADDLGYGDLGCYGQKQIQTPNLDQMAAEGMRFTAHYAGSTVCAPSRCCLMTGYHTGHALIRGNATVPLRPQDVTIPEVLQPAGYRSALIGKWGLGEAGSTGVPTKQGFDYFYGYLNQIRAHNFYPEFLWRNEEKVELDNEVIYTETGYSKGVGSAAVKQVDYSHDLFTQEALQFLRDNADLPFYLYLAFTIPHANNEYWLLDGHGMEVPEYGMYADKDWPEAQKGLAAMITRMDRDIGELLKTLQELGIEKNTLVMFSSDNGPHREGENDPDFFNSNGPLRGIKRDLYEGGIRVPLIARWPGTIPANTTSDLPSAFWDMMPTFVELTDVAAPQDTDGISMVPTLLGNFDHQKKHEFLYWEFHEGQASSQAVRMGKWKAVRHDPNSPLELYNLEQDIGEENNIADEHPDIVSRIEEYLRTARSESEVWPLESNM